MAKNKKKKCFNCNGKGLFPWCRICYTAGDMSQEQFDREVKPELERKARIAEEKERVKNMTYLERAEYDQRKDIARHRYLDNCKMLKKGLDTTMRSRKLFTGREALDEIIKNILDEITKEIHLMIDVEDLTTLPEVIAKFNELTNTTPDYSQHDRTPEEIEEYITKLQAKRTK